jgi:hypothetical protein
MLLLACSGKYSPHSDESLGDDPDERAEEQPIPSQGAMSVDLINPCMEASSTTCPTTSLTIDLPKAEGPNSDQYPAHLVDGEAAAQVSCRVASTDADAYEVEGVLASGGTRLLISDLTIADNQGDGVVMFGDSSQFSESYTGLCQFLTREAGTSLQIKAGSLWGSFACSSLTTQGGVARRATGFFILENCDQE